MRDEGLEVAMRKAETDLETLGCMDKLMKKWRKVAEIGGVRGPVGCLFTKIAFFVNNESVVLAGCK